MPKYPFTPEVLDALPEELAELYRALENTLLNEICSRLRIANQLNEVTVQDIQALRSHEVDLKEIEKAIRKTAGISEQKLKKLLDDVVERNRKYYTEVIDLAHITQPETLVDAATVDAIKQQTRDTFRNLTASMGFLVGNTMLKPARAYQWALDNAEMQIQSGAISYNQAVANAVRQLAENGIKVVDYESGHRDSIDDRRKPDLRQVHGASGGVFRDAVFRSFCSCGRTRHPRQIAVVISQRVARPRIFHP